MAATDHKTFRQQWAEYGSRPPVARWTARFSYAVLGPLAVLAVLVAVGWLAWRLLAWIF